MPLSLFDPFRKFDFTPRSNPFSYFSDLFDTSATKVDDTYDFSDLLTYDDYVNWTSAQAEINRKFQQSSADKAMAFSADEAEKARQFQLDYRDSAVSSYMNQLREAGINPILATDYASSGSVGATSASGVAASGSQASVTDGTISPKVLLNFLASVLSSAGSLAGNIAKAAAMS